MSPIGEVSTLCYESNINYNVIWHMWKRRKVCYGLLKVQDIIEIVIQCICLVPLTLQMGSIALTTAIFDIIYVQKRKLYFICLCISIIFNDIILILFTYTVRTPLEDY